MRKFTGVISFRFEPDRMAFLVSETKDLGF
jgi:hypothetical protein